MVSPNPCRAQFVRSSMRGFNDKQAYLLTLRRGDFKGIIIVQIYSLALRQGNLHLALRSHLLGRDSKATNIVKAYLLALWRWNLHFVLQSRPFGRDFKAINFSHHIQVDFNDQWSIYWVRIQTLTNIKSNINKYRIKHHDNCLTGRYSLASSSERV